MQHSVYYIKAHDKNDKSEEQDRCITYFEAVNTFSIDRVDGKSLSELKKSLKVRVARKGLIENHLIVIMIFYLQSMESQTLILCWE